MEALVIVMGHYRTLQKHCKSLQEDLERYGTVMENIDFANQLNFKFCSPLKR